MESNVEGRGFYHTPAKIRQHMNFIYLRSDLNTLLQRLEVLIEEKRQEIQMPIWEASTNLTEKFRLQIIAHME